MASTRKHPGAGQKTKHPGRTLIAFFVLILIMAGLLGYGVVRKYASPFPSLALDLEGGTQLILTPRATGDKANQTPSAEDIQQAIEIIRQRVDASGVSEAEITSQGNSNILVALPGHPSEETLDLVRQSAELNFRSVIQVGSPLPAIAAAQASTDGSTTAGTTSYTEEQVKEFAKQHADQNGDGTLSDEPSETPTDNSSDSWITEQVLYDFYALDCTNAKNREGGDSGDPKKPLVACSNDGSAKYILGPVDIAGSHITSATSSLGQNSSGQSTGQWVVNLEFDAQGTKAFADVTNRLYSYSLGDSTTSTDSQKNEFAIVLDGIVVSAPRVNSSITNGRAEISGSFTRETSQTLANQLQFGSLPLNFEVQSESNVSATLGSDQLRYGLWAGVIGLLLVCAYLIWQYRGLSTVAIGSLGCAAVILYLVLTLLSWWMGYRLSLAGVAGVIVSIGTTADSFIVYFERIRDEVRDGRPLSTAVEEGWNRAKRTIITSDGVNVLAALVLYFLAVGGVQGFAFTLGVTTVIDLAIIFWFTHPVMVRLLRYKFFGEGHKWSGLDPEHLGAQRGTYRYQGAGRVRQVKSVYKNAVKDADTDNTDARDKESAGASVALKTREAEKAEPDGEDTESKTEEVTADTAETYPRDKEATVERADTPDADNVSDKPGDQGKEVL